MSKVVCFKRLPTGEWVPDTDMEARCAAITLERDGDAFYARQLVQSAAQAYVKKLRCDD